MSISRTTSTSVVLVASTGILVTALAGCGASNGASSSPSTKAATENAATPTATTSVQPAPQLVTELPGSVTLAPSEQVDVELPAQAGTGYVWTVARLAGAPVEISKPTVSQPKKSGGDVTYSFTITGERAGTAKIAFSYLPVYQSKNPPTVPTGPGAGYLTVTIP